MTPSFSSNIEGWKSTQNRQKSSSSSSRRPSSPRALGVVHSGDNSDDEPAVIPTTSNNGAVPRSVITSSRRELVQAFLSSSTAAFVLLNSQKSALADDDDQVPVTTSMSPASSPPRAAIAPKVLVLGGSGFVGSRIVATLTELGIATIATSRDGRDGTVALNVLDDDVTSTVARLSQGCSAVISCIGAIGTEDDQAVNAATALAAQGAKQSGVQRFVYITVAPEVKEFAQGIDFLEGYMAGKSISRQAVLDLFREEAIFIEPTFIYGGGSFELNPPRVASFYGKFIEGLLSSGPIRSVERALAPGIVKIALEPPVPVEAVANAAVAGALGRTDAILDSYDKIKQAAATLETTAAA